MTESQAFTLWIKNMNDINRMIELAGLNNGNFKNTYEIGDLVNTPMGNGKIVDVQSQGEKQGKPVVKLDHSDDPDGDTFAFAYTMLKHLKPESELKELKRDTEFVHLDRATSDVISDFQLKKFDTIEQAIYHYAKIHKIHPKELATTVNFYLEHQEKLMQKTTENNESYDENGFITGERVRHKEQNRIGTVRGYEGGETAVEFDDEQGEIYYIDNQSLELAEANENNQPIIDEDEPSDAEMFGATEITDPIEGMEGPWRMKNGRTVYYDPREGKYYDRGMDMYLGDQEATALHFGNMDEEYSKFKEDNYPDNFNQQAFDAHWGEPSEVVEAMMDQAVADALYDAMRVNVTDYSKDADDYEGELENIVDEIIGNNASEDVREIPDWYDTMAQELNAVIGPKLKSHMGMLETNQSNSDVEIDLESAGFMDADNALRIKRMQDLAGIIGEVRKPGDES